MVFSLFLGIVLLVIGAAALVEAGSTLAKRMGVSPLWIGLTVVAFGTSAPELVVSGMAALRGNSAIAIGNVVGSNILNVLIVLGITAMVAPVPVKRVTLRRDMKLVVAVGLLIWALAADGLLHWGEGALLLALVIPYMIHIYKEEKRGWIPIEEPPAALDKYPTLLMVPVLLAGMVMLAFGGDQVVVGGSGIAQSLGISDRIIAITVIALGTSSPELATSLVALSKNKPDMAVGNIVGSNLLNMLLVLGAAIAIHPATVSKSVLWIDFPVMIAVSMLLFRFGTTEKRITRGEGGFLMLVYVGYVMLLLSGLLTI